MSDAGSAAPLVTGHKRKADAPSTQQQSPTRGSADGGNGGGRERGEVRGRGRGRGAGRGGGRGRGKGGKKWKQGNRFLQQCRDRRAYIDRACRAAGAPVGAAAAAAAAKVEAACNKDFGQASWKRIHGDIVDRSYTERFAIPGLPAPTGASEASLAARAAAAVKKAADSGDGGGGDGSGGGGSGGGSGAGHFSGAGGSHALDGDMYMQLHVNGLCVVGLAPYHPVLRACAGGLDAVVKVRYPHTIVQGKGQKKAAKVQPGTVIAEMELATGAKHRIRSPVAGKLFGHNRVLVKTPGTVTAYPRLEGYVAMVMLNGFEAQGIKDNLATAVEYDTIAQALYMDTSAAPAETATAVTATSTTGHLASSPPAGHVPAGGDATPAGPSEAAARAAAAAAAAASADEAGSPAALAEMQ